jgi:hemin uptake protein HemP
LACFGRSEDAFSACGDAVCARPLSVITAAIETTDAPKIRAREYLAPSAITPTQSSVLIWLACAARGERLAGYLWCRLPGPHCLIWLRGNTQAVNVTRLQFISIVNCRRWNALRAAYTNKRHLRFRKRITLIMSAPSGDDGGDATGAVQNPSATTRTLTMRGSRIDSRELFAVEREIIISHGEDSYRLRLTSQNKLILTK